MALQTYATLTTKTLSAASTTLLDTAVATQVATLQANRNKSTNDAGAGTFGVILGSLAITGYQTTITAADAITYSCQLSWMQFNAAQ